MYKQNFLKIACFVLLAIFCGCSEDDKPEQPEQPKPQEQPKPKAPNIEMVFVEGGTFTMGNNSNSNNNEGLASPTHQVTLSNFNIGKYEITEGQWKDVMLNNPSQTAMGNNYPVENVSWNSIVGTSGASMDINGITYRENGFIYKLNQLSGKTYRLPTEAEWEYAARGGKQSKGYTYSGSNTVTDVACIKLSNTYNAIRSAVGTKSPNELGIYDMSGNMAEWCSDRIGDYPSSAQTDPTGTIESIYRLGRVIRGGSCNDATYDFSARRCSVWYREYDVSGSSKSGSGSTLGYGFRLVLVP